MAGIHPIQPPVFDIEAWRRFGREYREEFDFCRILQGDWVVAADLYFESDPEAHAEGRALIRCFGSLLEGLTTSMRKIAVATGKLFRQPLNPFLQEKVEERAITAYQRIYTSYRLIGEFLPRSPLAATTDDFWDELHWAIEARNRIVHPRSASDLMVTEEEVWRVAEMGNELSTHVNKFAHWLSRKEEKLLWEHLAERRHIYPKIGRNEPCPCQSGRKYKHCCVAAAVAA